MDRDAIDAEQRDQARDQRRELAGWCREKLGDLRNWLPLPVGERQEAGPCQHISDGRLYTSEPPQLRCVRCGRFYPA